MSAPADLEQERLILDSVGRFLDREVKPHVHALEHDDIYPAEIFEGMKALGLFGATIGADYGGLGRSAAPYRKSVATVSTRWRSPAGIVKSQLCMVAPGDRVIGGAEGRGLQHALSGLELGRINVAARGVGVAKAALDEAVSYSQIRKTFGKPICEHQAIQLKLADMATQVEAARLLVESAARIYDRGERCDMEAGMAKLFASEAAVTCSMESMRIHGGSRYSEEFMGVPL